MTNRSHKTKRQPRNVGDLVRIDLGHGFCTYARVLDEALFAFYDSRVNEELSMDRIIALPILFQLAVMDHAVKRGRWVIVGSAPLDESLLNPPPQFMEDALRTGLFRLYSKGGKIRPATKGECVGLERAAVWDPTHVEDRLRDHYAGRKNKWVDSLRLKA